MTKFYKINRSSLEKRVKRSSLERKKAFEDSYRDFPKLGGGYLIQFFIDKRDVHDVMGAIDIIIKHFKQKPEVMQNEVYDWEITFAVEDCDIEYAVSLLEERFGRDVFVYRRVSRIDRYIYDQFDDENSMRVFGKK